MHLEEKDRLKDLNKCIIANCMKKMWSFLEKKETGSMNVQKKLLSFYSIRTMKGQRNSLPYKIFKCKYIICKYYLCKYVLLIIDITMAIEGIVEGKPKEKQFFIPM